MEERLRCRSKFASRFIATNEVGNVLGSCTRQRFESEKQYLIDDTLLDRKPVEVLHNRGDVIVFTSPGDYSGSSVLHPL